MMTKRVKLANLLFLMLALLLAGRLYYIQIACGPQLSEGAKRQQFIPVVEENARGIIYDRNMTRLTNSTYEYYYLIQQKNHTPACKGLLRLAGGEQAGSKGTEYVVYKVKDFDSSVNYLLQNQWNAYGFCTVSRYEDDQPAFHVLADLETMYDLLLTSEAPSCYFLGDGAGGMIDGLGMVSAESTGAAPSSSLMTTLDAELQKEIQNIFHRNGLTGAALVTESDTGNVLAMVSGPSFEEDRTNRAVERAYPMGTLWETVEQTALEQRISFAEMAQALGLGQSVFRGLPNENLGGTKEATPSQVCRMTGAFANGGMLRQLTLVKSQSGENQGDRMVLQETAGSGNQDSKELMVSGGWCTGWVDIDDKRYVITVYLEPEKQEKKGSHNGLTLFDEISQRLSDIN